MPSSSKLVGPARGARPCGRRRPAARRDQRDTGAGPAGPCGAADAVDVALVVLGRVVVHDVADAFEVEAARGDVGRDQHAHLPRSKRCSVLLAHRWGMSPWSASACIPFWRACGPAGRRRAGPNEHQGQLAVVLEEIDPGPRPCRARPPGRTGGRARRRSRARPRPRAGSRRACTRARGCRRRRRAWPRRTSSAGPSGYRRTMPVDLRLEAHVQHAVGLVQDQDPNAVQTERCRARPGPAACRASR